MAPLLESVFCFKVKLNISCCALAVGSLGCLTDSPGVGVYR
jgi:hypothetical protein